MKNKRKKIIIVSMNGMKPVGGVERVVFYLHQILSEKYEVKLLSIKISFGKLNLLIYPLLFSIYLCFIRNKFVISQSWQSFLYPVDLSIHHGTTKGFTQKCPDTVSIASKILSLMEKISAHTAKKVLAVSDNCKNELIYLYKVKERKIFILNNFVSEKQFFPMDKNNTISNERIILLFSGRLENGKGLQELQIISDYIEQFDNIELHIGCNDSGNTETFLNKKNTKLYIGMSFEQMNDFYNSGNVLIFPTKYEGFSMSTLEALSSGLCVVGTRFAVMPELQKYEFCKVRETFEPEELIEDCKKLVAIWKNKKLYIHECLKKDFGYEQYKNKLFNIMKLR